MRGSERRALRALVALALIAIGCDGAPDGPTPELKADVAELRRIVREDPAEAPIAEVERVAGGRPVLGAQLLASGAIPAARRQVALVRGATMTTEEGRGFARRIAEAYEQRLRGLERWHRYLEDAATDDAALLEAMTELRQATVALVHVDRDMDAVSPIQPRDGRGSRD